ncbi:angiotensin-converting enzyme-like isoform X1 [Littorina saxatilis]
MFSRVMWSSTQLLVVLWTVAMGVRGEAGSNVNETAAGEFLDMYNTEAQRVFSANAAVSWAFNTNITDENRQKSIQSDLQTDLWRQNMSHQAAVFNTSGFDPDMQRQFYKIKDIGTAALEDVAKLEELNSVLAQMSTIYSTARVCLTKTDCLPLDPDITREFEKSRNEERLRRLWVGWRDESGKKMRQLYTQFVDLSNEAVKTLGYADTGDYWRSKYETETFEQDVASLFEELKPFYTELHAFVRRRLKAQYGDSVFPASGHIPAHLLGNMWAQQWNSVQNLLMPYPDQPILDVTAEMVKQEYTAERIFHVADDFFASLGLTPMPQEFWNGSMLEKPQDGREVVCHASAWDFYNGIDFRVKQCTEVTMEHFSTAHHEMGHIEYFLQYKHQPVVYRGGANAGFHEAVGDVISLSVETPKHLHDIGLLPTLVENNEADTNFLMAMALQKIAFLPFGYLIDQWRWSVFRGQTHPSDYNKAWWKLRCELQGVSPPVARTEDDFDPGAKFHIPNNTPYIRYFVSFVLQFQFHKALCDAAGHTGPLHTCDIFNSTEAGTKLGEMLSMGSSKVWTEPFQALTNQTRMSAQPLMDYFQPLMTFLQKENGQDKGWQPDCPNLDPISSAGQASLHYLLTALLLLVLSSHALTLNWNC